MPDAASSFEPIGSADAPDAAPLRTLILMSRTGGGHIASAEALRTELLRQAPGTEIVVVDLLIDHLAFPFNQLPKSYDTVVNRAPQLWGRFWRLTCRPAVAGGASALVRRLSRRHIDALLRETHPDLVVSVHPLVNDLMLPVIAEAAPQARYVTVVTDLGGIHPLWLHPANAAVYVPTETVAQLAVSQGLQRDRIHVCGLPIRAEFALPPPPREAARAVFGLAPGLPAVLVMGGGGGIGPIAAIVENLALSLREGIGQVIVVTGKNAALRQELAARSWPVPVTALGYVERVSDLMHACDLLVTKAGPGTIAEASARGLPMLLYGFIPGQEEANVAHVVEAGAGLFEPNPAEIGRKVAGLLANGADLAAMAARASALGRPGATRDIVASILAGHRAR